MKILFLFAMAIGLSCTVVAQGKSGNKAGRGNQPSVLSTDTAGPKNKAPKGNKAKTNKPDKENKENGDADQAKQKRDEHDRKVWDGVAGSEGCGKPSKNQPAKVRAAFSRDYPRAVNVRWTKCRGDWTATFANGPFFSTAVYHANGDRRDTRTPVTRQEMPRVVLDSVFKRRPGINIGDVIRIELPGNAQDIFRIRTAPDSPEFIFLNKLGELVRYEY